MGGKETILSSGWGGGGGLHHRLEGHTSTSGHVILVTVSTEDRRSPVVVDPQQLLNTTSGSYHQNTIYWCTSIFVAPKLPSSLSPSPPPPTTTPPLTEKSLKKNPTKTSINASLTHNRHRSWQDVSHHWRQFWCWRHCWWIYRGAADDISCSSCSCWRKLGDISFNSGCISQMRCWPPSLKKEKRCTEVLMTLCVGGWGCGGCGGGRRETLNRCPQGAVCILTRACRRPGQVVCCAGICSMPFPSRHIPPFRLAVWVIVWRGGVGECGRGATMVCGGDGEVLLGWDRRGSIDRLPSTMVSPEPLRMRPSSCNERAPTQLAVFFFVFLFSVFCFFLFPYPSTSLSGWFHSWASS